MRITSNITTYTHIAMNYEVQTYNGLSHKTQLAKTETNDIPEIRREVRGGNRILFRQRQQQQYNC